MRTLLSVSIICKHTLHWPDWQGVPVCRLFTSAPLNVRHLLKTNKLVSVEFRVRSRRQTKPSIAERHPVGLMKTFDALESCFNGFDYLTKALKFKLVRAGSHSIWFNLVPCHSSVFRARPIPGWLSCVRLRNASFSKLFRCLAQLN